MPKNSPIQTNFSGGEFGPNIEGRVELERAETGLDTCYNYIPLIEGPLVRRWGTKFVAEAKDPSKPPRFIPFKFSNTDQYILEFGERYIRFYTNEGNVVTSGTSYIINGKMELGNSYDPFSPLGPLITSNAQGPYKSSRSTITGKPLEVFSTGVFSSVVSGTILEIPTYYDHNMIQGLGFSQKGDTIWLTHSSIPTFTLQRFGTQDWDLKYFHSKDGPYLPLNSTKTPGDLFNYKFNVFFQNNHQSNERARFRVRLISHSSVKVASMSDDGNGKIQVNTQSQHPFNDNDKVWINGVVGTTEANNGSSSLSTEFAPAPNPNNITESSVWTVSVLSGSSFVLQNSVFTNAYVGSGIVYPAMFKAGDAGRNVGLYIGGHRYNGVIQTGSNIFTANNFCPHPIRADVWVYQDSDQIPVASTIVDVWQMGAFNRDNGWPSTSTFHQDRLILAGMPGLPTEFDGSKIGQYQQFSTSEASSLVVTSANALQFNLVSESQDRLKWAKSGVQGLYFASESEEFLVSPSREGEALSPTNINNDIIGSYGSAEINPVRSGDAIIYLQNSEQKVRELRFFANLQSHKSTNISVLSDHITAPAIKGLAVQKEFFPLIWAYKSDGSLATLSYSREETQMVAGWASQGLGGRSDSAYSEPKVKAIEVMRSSDGKYDQLWMAVQRFINGTSTVTIEYMAKPYRYRDVTQKTRDAYFVDCGATFDSSLVIAGITQGSALVTINSHGLVRNDRVLVSDVIGLNSSLINVDGVIVNSNLVNDRYFIVGSTTTNNFFLQDVHSSIILTNTYSPYVSGGKVRKLVSQVGGLTWLKNEEVDLWGDGGYLGKATVNSASIVALPTPAAVVQVGYGYKSRMKTLVKDRGSKTGSAIGTLQKSYEIAVRGRDMADLHYGGVSFKTLHAASFQFADDQLADGATPLFTGIYRDGIEQDPSFYAQVYIEQRIPGPGMIQSITFMNDQTDL